MNTHSLRLARNFQRFSSAWFLALVHDVAEDVSYLRWTARLWPALDAITRREGEVYLSEYIPRVSKNRLARVVKMADINDNLSRNDGVMSESYRKRLSKAFDFLLLTHISEV